MSSLSYPIHSPADRHAFLSFKHRLPPPTLSDFAVLLSVPLPPSTFSVIALLLMCSNHVQPVFRHGVAMKMRALLPEAHMMDYRVPLALASAISIAMGIA